MPWIPPEKHNLPQGRLQWNAKTSDMVCHGYGKHRRRKNEIIAFAHQTSFTCASVCHCPDNTQGLLAIFRWRVGWTHIRPSHISGCSDLLHQRFSSTWRTRPRIHHSHWKHWFLDCPGTQMHLHRPTLPNYIFIDTRSQNQILSQALQGKLSFLRHNLPINNNSLRPALPHCSPTPTHR